MPEATQSEQLEQTPAAPEEAPQAVPEQQEAPEQPSEQKQPGQGNVLIPFLTVLLVLLGIGEAVFWGYFALSAYSQSLARERYEQQQRALMEEQTSKGIRGGSSLSPNLKVENGVVTWEREKWAYTWSSQSANTTSGPQREDGLRLARLPVASIPYTLAKEDTAADTQRNTQTNTEQTPASAAPETGGAVPLGT